MVYILVYNHIYLRSPKLLLWSFLLYFPSFAYTHLFLYFTFSFFFVPFLFSFPIFLLSILNFFPPSLVMQTAVWKQAFFPLVPLHLLNIDPFQSLNRKGYGTDFNKSSFSAKRRRQSYNNIQDQVKIVGKTLKKVVNIVPKYIPHSAAFFAMRKRYHIFHI